MKTDKRYLLRASKAFCIAPWTHMHVLTTGEIFPCCMSAHRSTNAIGHLRRGDSLESAWNSEKMRSLRRSMLSDEPSRLCERCYAMEAVGQQSWRMSENRELAHHFSVVTRTDEQGGVEGVHLPYLDIRFSNVCNLRCRICTPKLSSSWYQDGLAMGSVPPSQSAIVTATEDADALWNQIVPLIPQAERFHFAGGEPLLMDEHYRILDELLRRKMYHVKLSYNTNFSRLQYKSYDVLELWKQFRTIYLQASLDGMGRRGDYMRKGQNWDEVVRNRERTLQECPHIDFCILATVSIMNVLHLPDFYVDWVEKQYIKPSGIRLNILFEPKFFNIRGLPPSFKERVKEKYVDLIDNYLSGFGAEGRGAREHFGSVLLYMFAEDWDRLGEFRQYTKDLDVLRGESFKDVFPELADLVAPSRFVDFIHSGRSLVKFGRTDEALRDFDGAIEELSGTPSGPREPVPASGLHSTLARAFIERGRLKRERGDEQEAQLDFNRALEMDPLLTPDQVQEGHPIAGLPEPDPLRYAERAQRKRERGDWQGALQDLTRAVQLAPAIALEHINQSISASPDGVLRLFPLRREGKERDAFSTLALGYFLRGVAKRQLGDREGAVSDLATALDSEPFSFLEQAARDLIEEIE